MTPDTVIEVDRLSRRFGGVAALREVSLQVRRGEMVALLGASGSGKSTLLRHLSGLQLADAGSVSDIRVLGRPVQQGGRRAAGLRETRSRIATIFQQFNLVGRLSVMDNVLAGALHRQPLWRCVLRRLPADEQARAMAALQRVGIEACAWQRASTLSGGQQQRAAISRAILQGAEIVLADEPIASLDPASSRRVMALLAALCRETGVTVLVSLHQVEAAFAYCPRTVALRQGDVVYDGPTAALDPERLRTLYGTQTDELFEPALSPELHVAEPALPLAARMPLPAAVPTRLHAA